jgi:MFS family permease
MGFRTLPRSVWMLGFTSLFMDTSSEMSHSLLPMLLVGGLGASAFTLGLIDGVAEATTSVTKIFSGAISDWLGKRKLLAVLGYGLAAASKPLFPLAGSPLTVFVARMFDRLGKGIRGAPRDALIADVTEAHERGAAYGLRQGLDTIGAILGPGLAAGLMLLLAEDFRAVLWVAVVPAVICVLVLVVGVEEPARAKPTGPRVFPLRARELRRLGAGFWLAMAAIGLLLLPRFSEAFMLLRGQGLGLAAGAVPLILVAMNLVAAPAALLAGLWSDRIGRSGLLVAGFALLGAGELMLAHAADPAWVFLGAALWGIHLGITQTALSAFVADRAPADLRGTAFGAFHLVSGVAIFGGSLGAGWLWDGYGPAMPFWCGGVASLAGLAAFLALPRRVRRSPGS